MKKKGKNTPKKEEIAEDWCFVCKDGGLLMVCEYKHCLKAYHTDCVDKDDSFLEAGNRWTCDLHSCFICHRSTNVHCLCCPTAVCRRCIKDVEFVQIRGKKGFCRHCLKLALLVEEKLDVDSDGDNVNFKDRETYEGLFREYWEIINEKEGLTLENLQSADGRMRKGKFYKSSSDSDDHKEHEENEVIFDSDNADVTEVRKPNHRRKQSKVKKSAMKRKVISNRKEFIGWGSSTLIKFLESIGINVNDDFSQRDVTAIINDYIKEKKLFHPEKKKLVVCDGSLKSVLGRKIVNKHKIYDYLDPHFAENQQSSEEDEIGYNSENNNDIFVVCRKQKKLDKSTAFLEKDTRLNVSQLHYASIVPENINLVYLRRSLVQKLLEKPETFESKVIGSFVKVKSDPNDYFRKNSHQLMQVTGTTRNSGDRNTMKILLQVSGTPKDISISLLSDYDISEEECQELKLQVKNGLLKQPTIIELKQKARSLHEDITKHWIARELVLLQNRIDQANEKGWRRELFEYLQRKQILQTSEEQSRLLQKVPDVIADVGEVEFLSEDIKDDKKEDESSPISIQNGSLETPCDKWEGNGITSVAKEKEQHTLVPDEQAIAILKSDSHLYTSCELTDVEHGTAKNQQAMAFELVELSSDEGGNVNNKSSAATGNQGFEDPRSPIWFCIGPDGEKKGPYSMAFLKHWKEVSSYSSNFKVLKMGQSEKNAIPLNDAVTSLL